MPIGDGPDDGRQTVRDTSCPLDAPLPLPIADGLARWSQGIYALWYPIKRRSALMPFYRAAAALPAKSALLCELLVRPDDSPLRMNGSGLLILNAPWRFDAALAPELHALEAALGEPGASSRLQWLREPA